MKFGQFPLKLGALQSSMTLKVVDMLAERLKDSFSDSEDSFSWGELYAFACGIEWLFRFNGAVVNNALPGNATFTLPNWEALFRIPTNTTLCDVERRRILAARWQNADNSMSGIEDICKTVFAGSTIEVFTDGNATQYWAINPAPETGYDWVASVCIIHVVVDDSGFMSLDEYTRATLRLSEILDIVLPAWCSWSFAFKYQGNYFKVGEGLIGYSPLA